jgi:hypothetical protein
MVSLLFTRTGALALQTEDMREEAGGRFLITHRYDVWLWMTVSGGDRKTPKISTCI